MRIIFVRHPETEANVKKLLYGRTDSAYSEKGNASIAGVVKEFSEMSIDAIYASPLRRAFDLAQAISEGNNCQLEVIKDDRLMEMHFGLFENKTNEEAREIFGDGYDDFWHNFVNFQVPEGESMGQVKTRVTSFLNEVTEAGKMKQSFEDLMKEDPGKAIDLHDRGGKIIVVVAHALVIRGALSLLLDIPLKDIWHIDVKPASIIEVSYHGGFGILTKIRP